MGTSLADRLEAARPKPKPTGIEGWLLTLTEQDRAAFEAEVRDTRWTRNAVLEFLRGEGVAVGKDTVSTYLARLRREHS